MSGATDRPDGLAPGTWRMTARWHGQRLFGEPDFQEFELLREERRELPLPEGAIQGQDADTLLRAGERKR